MELPTQKKEISPKYKQRLRHTYDIYLSINQKISINPLPLEFNAKEVKTIYQTIQGRMTIDAFKEMPHRLWKFVISQKQVDSKITVR